MVAKLSIAIVSWNVREHLRACLRSLHQFYGLQIGTGQFEVFVVDNASADGSAELARQEFPWARLTVNEQNRGFAAANNQALAQASGEYCLLLNDDAEFIDERLHLLIGFADEHPEGGVFGPRLMNSDGTDQPSVRRFPTFWNQLLVLSKLPNLFPKLLSFYLAEDLDQDQPQLVDQVMGACLLVRRKCWEQLQGFDEGFFVWFEEVDLCKRAREAGWEVWYAPECRVLHHKGQSFQQQPFLTKQRVLMHSMRRYFWRHSTWAVYGLITVMTWVSLGFVAVIALWLKLGGRFKKPKRL